MHIGTVYTIGYHEYKSLQHDDAAQEWWRKKREWNTIAIEFIKAKLLVHIRGNSLMHFPNMKMYIYIYIRGNGKGGGTEALELAEQNW